MSFWHVAFRALLLLILPAVAPAQAPAPAVTLLAPGVSYRHVQAKTPEGEPWSIHVLEMSRGQKSVELLAVAGSDEGGAMQRELPTALAAGAGANVVGVVNGDYDLGAPYLGISDGLAIASGEVWTTGKPAWPNFSVLKNGEPAIGVPEVTIEMSRNKNKWTIAALNKPFGSAWGEGLRLYTRQFRASIRSERPFLAVVIGGLSRRPPISADASVNGEVLEIHESATEVVIPEGGAVLVQPPNVRIEGLPALTSLRRGQKVKLQLRVRMAGKKGVRHAIGGFPILVRGGKRDIVGTPSENLSRRHPRTAACYNTEKVIFVVVDGRQPQLSVGMTLEELGDLMVSLGCTVAMNTDGGGSSVMAVRFPQESNPGGASPPTTAVMAPLQIVNSPSDGRERGRGNAWVILARR